MWSVFVTLCVYLRLIRPDVAGLILPYPVGLMLPYAVTYEALCAW